MGRQPVLPTKANIEDHVPLHLNDGDWCEHCVSGKARLAQHKVEPADRERLAVTFSADCAFIGSEDAEEGVQPTLVVHDDDHMAFWSLGVAKKEVNAFASKHVVDVLDQSGYEGQKITSKKPIKSRASLF